MTRPLGSRSTPRLLPCEKRLALSASLATGWLLDAFEVQSLEQDSLSTQAEGEALLSSPLDQAESLAQSHDLTGAGQTIAVIDSGIAWDHVALGGGYGPGYRVVGGWDFAEDDANPYDDGPAGYHGTHVAGLLAGSSDDFRGIAPEADLVSLRVFDDDGAGELQWIESALQWVHDNQDTFESPITTVNLSAGAMLSDANRDAATSMLEDELQLLREDGILVFAAAGNFYGDSALEDALLYPASSDAVVPVTSIDAGGWLSDFAQRESGIISTFGETIVSSVPDHVFGWDGNVDDFATMNGTSMATPQVAAASVLIREAMIDQGLTPSADDVLNQLYQSAEIRTDSVSGIDYQVLDLSAAVSVGSEGSSGDPAFEGEATVITQYVGTADSDTATLDLRDGIRLTVGQETYTFDATATDLRIDLGSGADTLEILGSADAERLVLRPGHLPGQQASQLQTNTYELELSGLEHVTFVGGGGPDRATLYDSVGNDHLESRTGEATLSGTGFRFEVTQTPRTFVHATAGGSDTAFLYDSEADEVLAVRPQFTSLSGNDLFQLAYGFEQVNAYATAGGFDTAELRDSAGDDVMNITQVRASISSVGYQVSARGFDSVSANAISGGNDLVRIYSNSDESQASWHTTDSLTQWTGQDGQTRIARGFEQTLAFESFQEVDLQTQSAGQPASHWLPPADDEHKHAWLSEEASALRSVFESLA
ncbi:MAG: S8 family serine peptidase [Planctomycetota bacterium]